MKVPGKPRRLEIDFVRGIAILLVMFGHFKKPTTTHWALNFFNHFEEVASGRGVDLFFVLSGFLVGGLLLREYRDTGSIQAPRFLVRRAFKIWPSFYFFIFFHLLARHHPVKTFFWQNFFHVQNYLGSSLAQTWSLGVEEHFYFGLALILGFAAARKWSPVSILKLLGVISVAAFSIRCYYAWHMMNWAAFAHTESRVDSLIFGVAIAIVYHFMPALYRRLTIPVWPLVLAIALGCSYIAFTPQTDGRYTLAIGATVYYLTAAAFFILVTEHSGKLTQNWLYKAISIIGVYSYGLYLWHSAMLSVGEKVIARYPPTTAWFLGLTLQFVGACILAYITTRLVEWPMLYWRESIPWLRDTKPLAKSPDQQRSEQEGPGGDHKGGSEAVAVS